MKKLFLISALALSFLAAQAQTGPQYYAETPTADTAINTTAVSFVADKVFYGLGSLEVYVVADSISGSTAGNVYIEYSMEPTGSVWYTAQTTAINGVQTLIHLEDTTMTASRVRVRALGIGTQSTIIRPHFVFKRNY